MLVQELYLFSAKFNIRSNFRDPIAKGRICNWFLSRTSSKQKMTLVAQMSSMALSLLRLSTLQSKTIAGSACSFSCRKVACVISVVCILSPLFGTPKIFVLGI